MKIIISKICCRCTEDNDEESITSASECRKRTVIAEEIETKCNDIFSGLDNCNLHHISDYYCCFTDIIYSDGYKVYGCDFWLRDEVNNDEIENLIYNLKTGNYIKNKNIEVKSIDCNLKYIKLKILNLLFYFFLFYL